MRKITLLIASVLVLGLSSCDQIAKNQEQEIYNEVVEQSLEEYRIAKESGSAMDEYVAAGMVKAAYLQAKDQENYKKWVAKEKELAKEVGIE